jgi:hypothetical protein
LVVAPAEFPASIGSIAPPAKCASALGVSLNQAERPLSNSRIFHLV